MKIKYLIAIFIAIIVFACKDNRTDYERFVQTYREILVTREWHAYDTSIANRKVRRIFRKNGYDENSFQAEYFKYANSPINFSAVIDSLRADVKREIDSTRKAMFGD